MDKKYLSESKYQIRYSESFKRKVCEAYLNSNSTKKEIWEKYLGYKDEHGGLLRWLRQLGYIATSNKTKTVSLKLMSLEKDRIPDNPTELKLKIKALEKALEESQLKKKAYEKMIEIAEREFKIDIRKK